MRALLRELRRSGLRAMPFFLAIFFVLINALPLGIPEFSRVIPFLSIILVYYWSIYRPDLFSAWMALIVGLLQDFLGGGPVGLMALILLGVQGICLSQRRIVLSGGFLTGWGAFGIICSAAAAAIWIISSLYYVNVFSVIPVLAQCFLTVALYPLVAWILGRAERRIRVIR